MHVVKRPKAHLNYKENYLITKKFHKNVNERFAIQWTSEKQKMREENKKQKWKQCDEMDVTKMMHIFVTWLKSSNRRKIAWNGVECRRKIAQNEENEENDDVINVESKKKKKIIGSMSTIQSVIFFLMFCSI